MAEFSCQVFGLCPHVSQMLRRSVHVCSDAAPWFRRRGTFHARRKPAGLRSGRKWQTFWSFICSAGKKTILIPSETFPRSLSGKHHSTSLCFFTFFPPCWLAAKQAISSWLSLAQAWTHLLYASCLPLMTDLSCFWIGWAQRPAVSSRKCGCHLAHWFVAVLNA